MDSTVIAAIAGIAGTLLAGFGGAALNHYLSARRARTNVRRSYHNERRMSPLIRLSTDITTCLLRLDTSEDKQESKALCIELGTLLNQYLTERRANAEVKRTSNEKRVAPLIKLVTDIVIYLSKLDTSEDRLEMKAVCHDLNELSGSCWTQVAVSFGVDPRIDDKIINLLALAAKFAQARVNELNKAPSEEGKRSKKLRGELEREATRSLNLCFKVLDEG